MASLSSVFGFKVSAIRLLLILFAFSESVFNVVESYLEKMSNGSFACLSCSFSLFIDANFSMTERPANGESESSSLFLDVAKDYVFCLATAFAVILFISCFYLTFLAISLTTLRFCSSIPDFTAVFINDLAPLLD